MKTNTVNPDTPASPTETRTVLIADLADDDPRAVFAKAVMLGGQVIAGVRPDQMTNPTPCDEFDVRKMLGHLTLVLRKFAMIGRGESPFGLPDYVEGIADDGWSAAWLEAAHEVQAAWSDDELLDQIVQLPWAQLPGRVALAIYTSELTVHTWDLAKAVGQTPAWDDQVVRVSYEAMRLGLPAEGRVEEFEAVRRQMPEGEAGFSLPFGEAVESAPDAAPIDQLVAWTGRRP